MLETMRRLEKTLLAKVLLGLLVVAFGVWGISGIAGSAFDTALSLTGWGPKDLAHVGAITIKGDEFTTNLQTQLRNLNAQTGQSLTLDDARKMGFDKQVLDTMVSQAAITSAASKLKLAVSTKVIVDEIHADRTFQGSNGQFDMTTFRRVLENNRLSEPQFMGMQVRRHLDAAVLQTATANIGLPGIVAQALSQFTGETRDVKYFDVIATEADVAKPTDADLDAQYKANPGAYTAPEYRTAAVMAIDATTLAPSQSVTPEELQAGYDKDKQDYYTPEKRDIIQLTFADLDAAKKAKERIAGGEDILKIAGELKLAEADVTLKDKLKDDFLDPKIAAAAFGVAEGQVSDPVEGKLAIALLKAVKVSPAKQLTLDEVKEPLTQRLQLEKAKTQLQQVYESVEDARAQNMKFEDIAIKAGINITLLPPISATGQNQDGKDVDLANKPDVLKAIFGSDVGVENDALGVNDGYVWYDVRKVIPSAIKPLDQVKDQVTQDVVAVRVRDGAVEKAKKLVEELKGGKGIDALAEANGGPAKTATGLKRNKQTGEFDGVELSAAFSVPEQGFIYAPGGDGKSARVMQVVKVTLPAVMATSPELEQAKAQIQSALGNDLQAGLVTALKKDSGVEINAALWKQNTGGAAPPEE
jgi:peptidyl-prolyl cis-trans isomerase D